MLWCNGKLTHWKANNNEVAKGKKEENCEQESNFVPMKLAIHEEYNNTLHVCNVVSEENSTRGIQLYSCNRI